MPPRTTVGEAECEFVSTFIDVGNLFTLLSSRWRHRDPPAYGAAGGSPRFLRMIGSAALRRASRLASKVRRKSGIPLSAPPGPSAVPLTRTATPAASRAPRWTLVQWRRPPHRC